MLYPLQAALHHYHLSAFNNSRVRGSGEGPTRCHRKLYRGRPSPERSHVVSRNSTPSSRTTGGPSNAKGSVRGPPQSLTEQCYKLLFLT